jgi:hypothetical protein
MQDIWTNTSEYGAKAPRVGYLSDEQNARCERIRVARMLYRGQHRQAYLTEGRTQFDFPKLVSQGRTLQPYITYNVLRRATTTFADLAMGETPIIKIQGSAVQGSDIGDASAQAFIEDLIDRSDLHRVLYDAVRQASWAGEAMVEVLRWDGQVYVQNVAPSEIYPLGQLLPDGQYAAYRRFATASLEKTQLLLVTDYETGLIRRRCHRLDGGQIAGDADLASWPTKRADGSPLPAEEATGSDWNSIVWMANEIDEGQVSSDYDSESLIQLQDELNAKQTQIARVLAKHSDPKLAAPEASAAPGGNLFSGHDVFFFRTPDQIPQYVTWNADLANAIADRDFTLQAMCVALELSPILLGIKHGATPDAARKLRLEAMTTLSKVKRKTAYIDPFMTTVVETARRMRPESLSIAMSTSVELRDGLPVDEADEANTIATLMSAGAMSRRRAVERQLADADAAEAELAELDAQAKAATPPILMGMEPGHASDEATKRQSDEGGMQ